METIYLDYNATTPVDPRVLSAMVPFFSSEYGNPSSTHGPGRQARAAVEKARQQVAGLIGSQPAEIIFTSGGSESNNMILKGVAYTRRERGRHLITTTIEHPAILNPLRFLERTGYRVTYVPVDRFGIVDVAAIEAAITPDTILISVMHANNEVGTIEPIAAIGRLARARGILFHSDASQSLGKIPACVDELLVDALTISGHKLYGPKGVGALYLRQGVEIEPLVHGSGHENGRRAGTENVTSIVGLGQACAIASAELALQNGRTLALREKLYEGLRETFRFNLHLNGHPTRRLPNTLNVSIEGFQSDHVLALLPELAASNGSACHANSGKISPVLAAMGLAAPVAHGALRLSLGRWTTEDQIDQVLNLFARRLGTPTPRPAEAPTAEFLQL